VSTPEDIHPATAVVCLLNATSCSAGTGPGVAELPWAEAKALVDAGYACFGDTPPPNTFSSARPVTPP